MHAKNPLVSINIVTFNGERYIKKCLESIANQTEKNIEVNILDNNSQDNTKKEAEKIINAFKLNAKPYTLNANVGFAKGHNMLIEKSRGEYIVILNQDAWLDKDYVKNALEIFEKDARIAGLQPKIYRYDFIKDILALKDGKLVIDTTGLVMLRSRRVIARGQGQKDNGQFEKDEEVFGVDGAAPIFIRKALEDTKIPTTYNLQPTTYEYFDEDFFIYKEDVDLSWRLRLYGWKLMYIPSLIAYHERGSGESAALSYRAIIKERKHISQLAKSLSWRNQRLMQIKNELPLLYFRDFLPILFKEIASLAYILFFEPYALRSIKDFILLLPNALKKRAIIMKKRTISANKLARWF